MRPLIVSFTHAPKMYVCGASLGQRDHTNSFVEEGGRGRRQTLMAWKMIDDPPTYFQPLSKMGTALAMPPSGTNHTIVPESSRGLESRDRKQTDDQTDCLLCCVAVLLCCCVLFGILFASFFLSFDPFSSSSSRRRLAVCFVGPVVLHLTRSVRTALRPLARGRRPRREIKEGARKGDTHTHAASVRDEKKRQEREAEDRHTHNTRQRQQRGRRRRRDVLQTRRRFR